MLILAVLAIVLMVMDKRGNTFMHLRAALSIPLSPIQYIVSKPIQLFGKLGTAISTHDALLKENLDLKAEQLMLRAQVQRLLAIESENNQLKALVSSSANVQGKVLIAQVMAVDSDPFVHQIVLDKGGRDNVYIGQAVLDATGVMGQVIQVGPETSRVLLVSDPHSGVPVEVARNGTRSVSMGDSFTGKLHLINVPQTADIKVGDILMTSGLGQKYPAGYPLGQVINVIKDPGLQFASISVEASAHLDRSREVLLVWPNKTVPLAPLTRKPL